jgi:hypothetical protein
MNLQVGDVVMIDLPRNLKHEKIYAYNRAIGRVSELSKQDALIEFFVYDNERFPLSQLVHIDLEDHVHAYSNQTNY